MAQTRGEAVRPAGAPMVPMAAPRSTGPGGDTGGGGEDGGRIGQAATQTVERAKDAGGEVAQEARRRAEQEFDRRSEQAASRVSDTASDFREVADELRRKGKDRPARIAEQAAERIERVGSYLREADLDRLTSDAGRLGRTNPAAIVVGAAAVGVLAGRLLRASTPGHAGSTNGGSSPR